MARYAIFLEEVKYFLKDNEKDLVWLLRAAHHHPDHAKFNGQEELPEDDGALAQLVTHVRALENDPETFQPKPETGPDFFPLVYVVTAVDDSSRPFLRNLEDMRFTRGGLISVIQIPEDFQGRNSAQDTNAADRWTWGTLMPLYFQEIGRDRNQQQWLVPFYGTRRNRYEMQILERVDQEFLRSQWNTNSDRLFARHVALALVYPNPNDPDWIQVLTVFQHPPPQNLKPWEDPFTAGAWGIPGGSVDRAVDSNWIAAAMREFREEVNPSGLEAWSDAQAFDQNARGEYDFALVSLQNLCHINGREVQNMSRPCLNFVVARATPAFYRRTMAAPPDPRGREGQRIPLPEDFVTELPIAEGQQGDMKRYWQDSTVPCVEHDRFLWLDLDLRSGRPWHRNAHKYVKMLAKALQQGSVPRRSDRALGRVLQVNQAAPAPYPAAEVASPWVEDRTVRGR